MKDLNSLVVRNMFNRIDISQTVAALEFELQGEKDVEYERECKIETAIGDVFYRHDDATLPMEAFAAEVASALNVQPAEYSALVKDIKAYVRCRPSTYTIGKGKGGGIFRNASRPSE